MKQLILTLLLSNLIITITEAQMAFDCNDGPFIIGATSNQPLPTLYQIDTGTLPFTFTPISTPGISFNAMGYRISDNLIYGIEESGVGSSSANLIQVDAAGTTTNLGAINGLPVDRYISGDFDNNGVLYVSNAINSDIFTIDVDNRIVINQFSYTTNYRFSDIAYNPQDGMLYAVSTVNTFLPEVAGQLLRIDPGNGNLTEIGTGSNDNTGIGSVSFDVNGTLYAVDNLTVGVYAINTSTGSRNLLSTSPAFSRADSAHCANAVFQGPSPLPAPVPAPTLNALGLILLSLMLILMVKTTVTRKHI